MDWDKHSNKNKQQRSIEEFLQDLFDKPHLFLTVIAALFAISGLFTSFYSVPPEEKAVITRLGKFLATNSEGLHFKIPFGIDKVTLVPTSKQEESFGFTTTNAQNNNASLLRARQLGQQSAANNNPFSKSLARSTVGRNLDNESLMLTGDLNVANVEWVVQYQVRDPRQFLFSVADPVKNIRDLSQTTMRRVVGDLGINDVLTTGRRDVEKKVKSLMQKTIDEKYKMGVEILEVILQNVAPPDPVQPSFNQVNSAIQEQKQEINRAQQAQNKLIDPAVGKATREISQSRGYAEAVVNRAIGDASRFNSIYEEYAKAPEVTRRRLYLDLAEQIMSRVKNFTIVDPELKGIMPIYSTNSNSASADSKSGQDLNRSDIRAAISSQNLSDENFSSGSDSVDTNRSVINNMSKIGR